MVTADAFHGQGGLDMSDEEHAEIAVLAERAGIESPDVRRLDLDASRDRISVVTWGEGAPEWVFLHGHGMSAHAWSRTIVGMGAPSSVVLDLPGHGESAWYEDGAYSLSRMAGTVQIALERIVAAPVTLVGHSIGGMIATYLSSWVPSIVKQLVLVESTPFGAGPLEERRPLPHSGSFAAMVEAVHSRMPSRSRDSVERSVRRNARQLPDGSWSWKWDLRSVIRMDDAEKAELLRLVAALRPTPTFVVGGRSTTLDNARRHQLEREVPGVRVRVVPGAGHNLPGDAPVELATVLIEEKV